MKCLNNCGKDVSGRSKYCSDSCKVLHNRKQKRKQSETVNSDIVTDAVAVFMDDMSISLDVKPEIAILDPDVQAIWDRRNAQGQAALYGDWPDRTEAKVI